MYFCSPTNVLNRTSRSASLNYDLHNISSSKRRQQQYRHSNQHVSSYVYKENIYSIKILYINHCGALTTLTPEIVANLPKQETEFLTTSIDLKFLNHVPAVSYTRKYNSNSLLYIYNFKDFKKSQIVLVDFFVIYI